MIRPSGFFSHKHVRNPSYDGFRSLLLKLKLKQHKNSTQLLLLLLSKQFKYTITLYVVDDKTREQMFDECKCLWFKSSWYNRI